MIPARSRLHAVASVVGRAFTWWGDGLKMTLPAPLVALVLGDTRILHLDIEDGDGRMRARLFASSFRSRVVTEALVADDGGGPREMPRSLVAAARSRPVVLHVSGQAVLSRTVTLPTVALEDLRQAVRFGLSRWTPFSADDVVYDAVVVGTTAEQATVRVRMVPRTILEPFVDRARRAGLGVTQIALGSANVAYAPTAPRGTRAQRANRIDAALLTSALLITVAIPILLHLRGNDALRDLRASVQAEVAHRTRQVALETELVRLAGWRRTALLKRAKVKRVSSVVADLARALPPEILVQEFSWSGERGQARLSGEPDRINAALSLLRSTRLERLTELTKGVFRAELVARDDPP
ncbi:hypothetical protein [Methylorubrum thiocyanatum]|uniref:hypothetical protein n=1 Tax=Methylorubrum thiocyanatum TaxID=47958 RepID=UPI003F7F78FB|nr:hypothetical protein [Methylobacterium sp. J-043]